MNTRQEALKWWNSINGSHLQHDLGKAFEKTRSVLVRDVPFTGKEIETIYNNYQVTMKTVKPESLVGFEGHSTLAHSKDPIKSLYMVTKLGEALHPTVTFEVFSTGEKVHTSQCVTDALNCYNNIQI